MFALTLLVLCLASRVSASDLHESVRTLQAQMATLLENKEQQGQLIGQLKELRDEVVVLREKCRGLRNVATRTKWLEASLSEARGQISELGAALDKAEGDITYLRSQLQADSRTLSKFTAAKETSSYAEDMENEVYKPSSDFDKKTRHHRVIRKRIENLEASTKAIFQAQKDFDTRLDSMDDRLNNVDVSNSSSVDKVHASMLELLESVEALETKVDSSLPTVQKEISRTELSLGQLMQQTAVMKEEQDNQKLSLKALSVGLSSVQDKLSQAGNSSLQPAHVKVSSSSTDVIGQLNTIIGEYKNVVRALPTDCRGVKGKKLEMVQLEEEPRLVSCDDGWTVIQKRKDGTVQFNRDWEEYAKGFGNPAGEFWIGNEALHALTKNNNTKLRVDMMDIYGHLWSAEYASFTIGNRTSGFKLTVAGYSGNASDALDYQNGMQFSARDSDRDISNTHCAANYEGGWWFSHCQHANLNGRYNLGLTWFHAAKNEWIAVSESTMRVTSN
ncbi:hypothetical protein GE061_004335 [Apolygus lucorum]|uniref:Fibrinogen C-terminal domain-containing protein n=1 Tax=Apolygus lucorum TaxID=248454 RepID=A0A8S9X0E7_APOLU|nr:hypothetical protein GE061_004335 [Apolygus lucorum]